MNSRRFRKPEIYFSLKERAKIEQYVENCMKGILLDDKKYKKLENPKISIIIPVYNKDNFILKTLRSIQNQSFKDIEIIFCDDNSNDNTTILIKEFQKEDERIVLLNKKRNIGTLRNRIEGAKIAKGEYILFLDADDLLMDNILEKVYLIANKSNIDIVQFQSYSGNFFNSFHAFDKNRTTEIIYQPALSNLMYYEKGYLIQTEFFIWGKLIKKEIFIKAINSIDDYFLNQNMSLHEDGLTLFVLFKKARSYKFIKDFGMLYYSNKNSTLYNIRNKDRINKTVKDCFLYLEFMFNYTNNTLYEKNMAICQFKHLIHEFYDVFLKVTTGFHYFYKILDLYLNCDIILKEDKEEIKKLKDELKKIQFNQS